MTSASRKAANHSLDSVLLVQPRELDTIQACSAEDGVSEAGKAGRERPWVEENAEAIKAHKNYTAKSGLPPENFRTH